MMISVQAPMNNKPLIGVTLDVHLLVQLLCVCGEGGWDVINDTLHSYTVDSNEKKMFGYCVFCAMHLYIVYSPYT